VEAQHLRIAAIALEAAGSYGLALAGGYAISAHGMGNRPSGDVDLFTDWQCRADFLAAVDVVVAALIRHGYQVETVNRSEVFARLLVAMPGADSSPEKVEMAADWRAHPPVMLDVGPVLHADDAVANKMCALYGRALARDFLDIDAAVTTGRYTRERLLQLAAQADAGFDRAMFADALGALTQITDEAFAIYHLSAAETKAMRRRFADWRDHLRPPP
jgi:hypothetical protein